MRWVGACTLRPARDNSTVACQGALLRCTEGTESRIMQAGLPPTRVSCNPNAHSCNATPLLQYYSQDNVGLLLPEKDLLVYLQEALLPMPHHTTYRYQATQRAPGPSIAPNQPSQPPFQHNTEGATAGHQPSRCVRQLLRISPMPPRCLLRTTWLRGF